MTYDEINRINTTMANFLFPEPVSRAEAFAQARFMKKFEKPDPSKTRTLREETWFSYINRDITLDRPDCKRLYPAVLYKARLIINELLRNLPPVIGNYLPKGSEFTPTKGRNSIESRLISSEWTVTTECFDLFFNEVKSTRALRVALKKRFAKLVLEKTSSTLREANKYLWQRFGNADDILKAKLRLICKFVDGSRFATVPKNNKVRRPINIEPFGNLIVQRHIGAQIRQVIKSKYYDLDRLAEIHANRIKNPKLSTIDFSNASDSISINLVRFLVPKRFFALLMNARSNYLRCPEGGWIPLNKISSMGNGFTFELMSLILVVIARCFDSQASVFGDDVVIANESANAFVSTCTDIGFVVNKDKTFINSDFRESCGANWLEGHGYIESYDFEWATNPGELIVNMNKLYRLCFQYPSFMRLRAAVMRQIPKAMQRGPSVDLENRSFYTRALHSRRDSDGKPDYQFPEYLVSSELKGEKVTDSFLISKLRDFGYNPHSFRLVKGFKHSEKLRSSTLTDLPSGKWAKYFMYLAGGRRTKDVLSGHGTWVKTSFLVSKQSTIRTKALAEL